MKPSEAESDAQKDLGAPSLCSSVKEKNTTTKLWDSAAKINQLSN